MSEKSPNQQTIKYPHANQEQTLCNHRFCFFFAQSKTNIRSELLAFVNELNPHGKNDMSVEFCALLTFGYKQNNDNQRVLNPESKIWSLQTGHIKGITAIWFKYLLGPVSTRSLTPPTPIHTPSPNTPPSPNTFHHRTPPLNFTKHPPPPSTHPPTLTTQPLPPNPKLK